MTMYQYPDYLAHFGVKGMKWGQRRAARNKRRLDKKDEKYLRRNPVYFDLGSARSKKKAGKEIKANADAWTLYMTTRSPKDYKAFQKASADMMTKLASDVELPSGRKMEYIADYVGQKGETPYKFVKR